MAEHCGAGLAALSQRHALIIEGAGSRDTRNPAQVAALLCGTIRARWAAHPPSAEAILVIQGDPLTEHGISAITRAIAAELGLERCLVTLDETIDPTHTRDADRAGVTLELCYSQLAAALSTVADESPGTCGATMLQRLEGAIDEALREKNADRQASGVPPLAAYYRDYALLQEVTKVACHRLCGAGVTMAHTAREADISSHSVTSFYQVGLALGLVQRTDLLAFDDGEAASDSWVSLPIGEPDTSGVAPGATDAPAPSAMFELSLAKPLVAVATSPAAAEAAETVAEGQAAWLLTCGLPAAARKHPGVRLELLGRSTLRVTGSPVQGAGAAEFEETWRKTIMAAIKKVDVEDLGDMDADRLRASIPEEDASGRGLRDLARLEKELAVKVVFCSNRHVLLVGAKTKLQKKCFVLRNLLSHYHWRLSGRDVAFNTMVAKR
jgi:hypothetical protein